MTRQPDFSTVTREGRAPAWDTLAVILAGLALAVAVGGAWRARVEARTASDRLAGVRREADAAAARLGALEARGRAEARGLLPAAEALPAQVVAGLAAALPGDARLERLSIDYARGGALEMHVVARDAAAWDRLIAQLEGSPDFREVAPGPETRDAEVRSAIRARWAGRAR